MSLIYNHVKFGHKGLDSLTTIEPGIVTAIVGRAGTGKTSLCLFLAKNATKPYFIDTEGLSLNRVKQIGVEHIKIAKVREFKNQTKLINKLNLDTDLLIIDSLVLLYRLQVHDNPNKMNTLLAKQILKLHSIAETKNIPVIITGHVYKKDGKLHIVGGDVIKYLAKTILLLKKTGTGKRKAILVKHRSRPENKEAKFKLCDKGIC